MVERFSVTLERFAEKSEQRMKAVMQMSVQDVIDDAQLSVAKGGRMRVDTGFLRASGTASLTGMPSGPVRGDKDFYADDSAAIELVIAGFGPGKTFWFGWSANYARAREAKDAFLRMAAQRFPFYVKKNIQIAKARWK